MFCSARLLDSSREEKVEQCMELRSVQTDWAASWERNEPLRDADEVAVPVLYLYSTDDPLLPPASTLPMSIFQIQRFAVPRHLLCPDNHFLIFLPYFKKTKHTHTSVRCILKLLYYR